MDKRELIKFFSEYWNIDPAKVTDDLELNDESLEGQTSIRLYQFFSEIESKFGVRVENITDIKTFGDLANNIS